MANSSASASFTGKAKCQNCMTPSESAQPSQKLSNQTQPEASGLPKRRQDSQAQAAEEQKQAAAKSARRCPLAG